VKYASQFSNASESYKSSLGFLYHGQKFIPEKHGMSLRLDGLERVNDNAHVKGVVMHAAEITYLILL
jgi:hypothetical protein